ncbi:hypothetical protein K9L67_02225 [Candidatus Woesearchaeota archaeon]|nr:hypothetical protein [Candidatus Woesearchaeota archaeon]MCF8013398.1 hypothetical protein [Candidatus Woesearchaeota archaeon]
MWIIKKGLLKSNIETKSLWWILLPVVGYILVIVSFSKALEKRFNVKFIVWFLIFFFFNGFDVIVNQAIINSKLSE